MPTPWEILTDPISLLVFAIYGALIAWELLAPARALPSIKGWHARAMLSFLVYFFLSSYLPLLWDEHLAAYQLFDLSSLGTWGGAAVGLVVYNAAFYAYHRMAHRSRFLWLGMHQMHHSAERLDTFGAFYFSLTDMVGVTFVGSLSLALIVGISPSAVTVFLLFGVLMAVFQHANVHTPRWLGYLVQRPESHSVHHGRGIHHFNYSDLPIFDLLFGTFRNPKDFQAETGFYNGASARVAEMLAFQDVSQPKRERAVALSTGLRTSSSG